MADIQKTKFTTVDGDNLIILPDLSGAINGDVLTYNSELDKVEWQAPEAGSTYSAGLDLEIVDDTIRVSSLGSAFGQYAFVEGGPNIASGMFSHAEGGLREEYYDDEELIVQELGNSALGMASHVEGAFTVADGWASHAEGIMTVASAAQSQGMPGMAAHAEGYGSNALAIASHAEGANTQAYAMATHAEGYRTTASAATYGYGASHAEGIQTEAIKDGAHAEGGYTIASGVASHAEGEYTHANGEASHAEGYYTTADGMLSHTEGNMTIASGACSHAEGYRTSAIGHESHAEGIHTVASGKMAHAEGGYNYNDTWAKIGTSAIGDASHTEGIGTIAESSGMHVGGFFNKTSTDALFVIGNGSIADGTGQWAITRSDAFVIDKSGVASAVNMKTSAGIVIATTATPTANQVLSYNGSDIIWADSQGGGGTELTAGTDLVINNGIIGVNTTSTAIGNYAFVEGDNNTAKGNYSHAEGAYSLANGIASHAEGWSTSAIGKYSHAEGDFTSAIGYYSHTEGYKTSAVGKESHAEGSETVASGDDSHAAGSATSALGNRSVAFGYGSQASGNAAFAEGIGTSAIGEGSHAEGGEVHYGMLSGTIASGTASHSEGVSTSAIGDYSHAEGFRTIASGDSSHSEGNGTSALGRQSHAAGCETRAIDAEMFVCGRANATISGAAFVVGNGYCATADMHAGSDAFIVDWNGVASAVNMYTSAGAVVATTSTPTANQVLSYNGTNVVWADSQGGGGGVSPVITTDLTPVLQDNLYIVTVPNNNAYYNVTIPDGHNIRVTLPVLNANENYNIILFIFAEDPSDKQLAIEDASGQLYQDLYPMNTTSEGGRIYGMGLAQLTIFGKGYTLAGKCTEWS